MCVCVCSYVLGGDTGCGVASDVWCSGDGEHWELVWAEKHCCARIGHSVVTFKYTSMHTHRERGTDTLGKGPLFSVGPSKHCSQ